ncbi:wax ester/triacylglycerol synthase family O-acyltransferase [Marinobacter changyiensis]|uniref:wax ester/triacylglycerol synthase family O-acyltransferase n=1 Tax=Marinobacter changyiensis TaxID=2604091 RepID=UPI00126427B3|nr:wax ester/triacylglycerol synthase family O-acyltransferase [Marinobacter changyiensis]
MTAPDPESLKYTKMSAVDRSWLRMECVENPMMISAVLIFEQPIPMARLRQVLGERFLRFRRFRQKIIQKGDKVHWHDDPLFDLDNHVHRIALPGKANKQNLQRLTSDLNSTPLDFNHPLWQIHYIDNYRGGCALLIRIHHCIADGISLVRVMLSLTDASPDASDTRVFRLPSQTPPTVDERFSLKRVISRVSELGSTALNQLAVLGDAIRKDARYPIKLADTAGKIAMECVKLALIPCEPKTGLTTPLSGRKRVAWADPLSLAEVKVCARALKGTVNDVLMACATGALHKHFHETGEAIPECGIRVAVPFNLRSLRQPIETLGNQFGLVLLTLPVDVDCPIMRFRQVQEHMNRLKRSCQAQVTYSLLDLFGRGPDMLERRALKILSQKASAVLTNVPGPKKAVYLAGSKLKQPMFWVPQTGSIGIGMSIFSYAGTVQFGMTIDKNIKADPDVLMDYFRESFHELRDRALQLQHPLQDDMKNGENAGQAFTL